MEAIKILEEAKDINWDYDEEADVQYLSIGEPKKAAGVDIGQGIVIRLDEEKNEVSRADSNRYAFKTNRDFKINFSVKCHQRNSIK